MLILRKGKKRYFANLNEKDITDNNKSWHTVKPFRSGKTKSGEKITLIESENLVSDDAEVANCLNNFFCNVVENLEIPKYEVEDALHLNMNSHPTLKAFFKYKNHAIIISIRCLHYQVSNVNFFCIDKNTVLKEIRGLSTTKASQDTVLPVEMLKENADYFAEFICIQFNNSVYSSKFPSSFKCGNITPIFKNESRNHKRNYTPVSILPIVSKIFEKIMSNQLSTYSEKFFQNSRVVS